MKNLVISASLSLDERINVKVKSTSIFGGTTNKVKDEKENAPTIYIKSFCLFGGVEIK